MEAGRKTCINIINVAVISTSIVKSVIRFFKSRSTISSVPVVKARGSGRVGGLDISLLGSFWVFRALISPRKGSGGLGGEDWYLRSWILALAGVVLVGIAHERPTFRRVGPRMVLVPDLGSGFPRGLVRGLGGKLGRGGFAGFNSWFGLVSGPRGGRPETTKSRRVVGVAIVSARGGLASMQVGQTRRWRFAPLCRPC